MFVYPKHLLRQKQGFTMIELLVALSIFSIIITIVSGIFISSLRSNRTAIALISANNDASLTLDQMSRMIRKGEGSTFGTNTILSDPSDPKTVIYECLYFKSGNDWITYRWNNNAAKQTLEWNSQTSGRIPCNTVTTDAFSGIVSENLSVVSANFRVEKGLDSTGEINNSKYQTYPKITILLGVGTKGTQISRNANSFTSLQTTVSPRNDNRY